MAVHAIARRVQAVATASSLHDWAAAYDRTHADIGTGDARFAIDLARHSPDTAVIAIDANLDHLRGSRRRDPANLCFVVANALDWPLGSLPRVDVATVNFPYGSLLRGLVEGDPDLVERLDALLPPGGRFEARVNASALLAGGLDPDGAPEAIVAALRRVGGMRIGWRPLDRGELRALPSSWAKRLGHGREAAAWLVDGQREP